jgi:hypothetical protein
MSIIPATFIHVAIAVYFVRHERRIGMAFALVCFPTLEELASANTPLRSFFMPQTSHI